MTWEESALRFEFGPAWTVRRYDAHRFYQAISGSDMKGVDFVAIYEQRYLLLIEVKNYTKRYGDQLPRVVPPLDDPAAFAAHVGRKWHDSLHAVRIFRLALLRDWRYRLFHRWLNRFLAPRHDWRFWTRAYHLSQLPGATHALLWLELADRYPKRERGANRQEQLDRVAQHLEAALPPGVHSVCINSTRHPLPATLLRVVRV